MTDPKITNDVPSPTETVLEAGQLPNEVEPPSRAHQVLRDIVGGSAMISFLAVVLALVAGGILIAFTDKDVQAAAGYFFSRPADTFRAIWDAVSGAYVALFQGSIYNFRRPGFADGIKPLTETLTFATPLIAAGLGVAVAFRAGLFNIGGRGQMLVAAGAAGYVGFAWPLPFGIHLIVAVAMGMLAGAIWGGIVGLLKARTGAHEVIVTIMLNYVAYYLIAFLLRTPGALQAPGSTNPKSPAMLPTAVFPELFGPKYNLHLGFLFAIAATVWVWYLINRSNLGFQFRAVGENPNAARVAGMNVKNIYVYAMLISGALVGLAGVAQVLGTVTTGFTQGIDAGIGFDAITVALLGRSKPIGVFFAGILFGALKAGGYSMQAAQGVPIDIVLVVQSLIVLFIAAPPLVRAIFRLPVPGTRAISRASRLTGKKAVVTK
ncbi:MAG TPA: ABC transporter permease [Rhodoglobus sp.]|jgi:simple sugar transport system permease protein|nr:ABC transporter permease [Rhodoglobus sp.]HQE46181.1 ABC transporter permease [Rhodoglobus sp.]HQI66969.1 ABC transporter permease [Rhodoglobus sp.]HQJ35830.1 ABC transporter permease [Rhodoglobus sp.]